MNDLTKEKTVRCSSVGADNGQSEQNNVNKSITDDEENINSFAEKFARMQKEFRRSMPYASLRSRTSLLGSDQGGPRGDGQTAGR